MADAIPKIITTPAGRSAALQRQETTSSTTIDGNSSHLAIRGVESLTLKSRDSAFVQQETCSKAEKPYSIACAATQ